MKHIIKQPEPQAFIDWKAQANEDWQPSYDKLSNPEKKVVKDSLIAEQGRLCCYCERALIEADSHIEHFEPQEDFPEKALDYGNMLCSCQQVIEKGEPRHCGNLKDNWYDAALTISPLDPDCEARFTYTYDGRIDASDPDDKGALKTIEYTGLDILKFNALREGAIDGFIDENLSLEDLKEFVTDYLKPNTKGHFSEFHTTIHQLFGEYLSA